MRTSWRWLAGATALALLAWGGAAVNGRIARSAGGTLTATGTFAETPDQPFDCSLRIVAGGDGVVEGKDASTPSEDNYAYQLLKEHAEPAPVPGPWCLYNTAKDAATTDTYQNDSPPTQLAQTWNLRPALITLTLGRQNSTIVDSIDKCFKNIKDHDFIEANACALNVLVNPTHWDKLTRDLSYILNQYKVQMDGNPNLVVAVTGYFNPYPSALDVVTKIPQFCANLIDTIPTCTIRWILLPPALVTLDQVVKKLNTTIENVVKQFRLASQGRYFFVNPYDKFKDHCMKMEVEIKTKVYHPTNTVHDHNSTKDFGCSTPWIASDGTDGTKTPLLYLTPAATGVLLVATQTTKGMGVNPNSDGHDCISDLVWEATKYKLGVAEPPETPCS